ncbi:aminopeptidase C [Prolixibacter sp. SD074]|jgi:bleomycin hydrolase|uniref:aminopeptidase C n=1 Tax=Prolixibacter sp. SD074 TaxID=2652391 RepID=UPI001271868C|nr:C1 family peptidase [Prolixibacter sp. SD074]GET29301.1 aminopeptidase [Prolixibacter sp. SD074]
MNRFKFFILLAGLLAFTWNVSAQDKEKSSKEEGYHFTAVKELPHTSVKNQYRSGTCWAFSGLSFLESEMLRMDKPEVDLSEMFVVYQCYIDKAIKTVRLHGNLNFGPGGAFHDVTYVLKNYGIVPDSVYTGLNYGETKHVHGEMDDVLKGIVDAVVENKNKKLSTAWEESVTGTLDAYLGELPAKFDYKGKTYSPKTFATDYCRLNPDDYVEITSFTHHPFYSKFKLEVPDNWEWGEVYNVPLDEMMKIIDNSLNSGYTVAWAADVSEKGFSTSKKGVAVVPDADVKEMTGSELSKWEKLTAKEKNEQLFKLDKPGKEKHITQEMRQEAFDDWQTTDDHGMHIIGLAKDQNGTMYYKVKNSWGDYNAWDGYFYASKPYVRYKTTCIMVNKHAIPKAIREKLGF